MKGRTRFLTCSVLHGGFLAGDGERLPAGIGDSSWTGADNRLGYGLSSSLFSEGSNSKIEKQSAVSNINHQINTKTSSTLT